MKCLNSQYSTFLKTVVCKNEDEFSNFDYTKDRLDKFLGKFLIGAVKYCILWEVCKFVFILMAKHQLREVLM